jgi:gliding motility-associated-like protein
MERKNLVSVFKLISLSLFGEYVHSFKSYWIGRNLKSDHRTRSIIIGFYLILVFLVISQDASAALKTWQLPGSGSWITGANWSGGTIPVAGDDVVINMTSSGTISGVPSTSLNSLSIGGSGNVTLTSTAGAIITISNFTAIPAFNINSGITLTLGAGTAATAVNINFSTISTPTSISGTLTNRANNNILISASQTLTVSGTFNAVSGAITVNGTISNSGTITGVNGSLFFNPASAYIHNRDGGSIPEATWNVTSSCIVTGITGTMPSGLEQAFGNFIWNCTGQTSAVDLQGAKTTVNGNMSVSSTNGQVLHLNSNAGSSTLTVKGDFSISGASTILNLTNGLSYETVHVEGNFIMTGGSLTGSNGTPEGDAAIVFNKSGTQTFTKTGGTISQDVNFYVSSGSILDVGTSVIDGSTGDFVLNSGATLITANSDGISLNGPTGSIQVTGARVFNSGANYTYNGTVPQITGSGLPITVNDLTIDNPSGVTLSGDVSVSNNLVMSQGNVTTGTSTLFLSNSLVGSLLYTSGTVIGNLKRSISTTLFTDYLFPVGTAASYRPASISFSSLAAPVDITAQFVAEAPNGFVSYMDGGVTVANLFTEGYWRFASSSVQAANFSLSLTGTGFSSYSISDGCRISGRDNSNPAWRPIGVHGTVTGNTITRTAISDLNTASFDFAFGTGCGIASMAYAYERDITLNYTKVAGGKDLSNFPVLINLTSLDFLKPFPAGQILNPNCYDLIFTDGNYNKLDHQIEYYSSTDGDFIAWVRIPTLSSSINTVIKILYGNPAVTTDPSVTSVWDSHYKGVWHLDNSSLNDFTSFGRSGTPFNSPTYQEGMVYNSLDLDGGNQYAGVSNAPNLNLTGNVTVSAWIFLNGLGLEQKIAGNQNNITGGYKLGVYANNKLEFENRTATNTTYNNRAVAGGTTLTSGQWYYVAGMSSDVLDSIKTFVSGIPERPFLKAGALGAASNNLTIGREPWTGSYFWNGRIDELRISDAVRSNGWLRTEYNNQSSPSTFYSLGDENSANNVVSAGICAGPITLTFGYPAGGTYSGNSFISGNVFTPPSSGTYTITYTYISGCGTTSVTKDFIIVDVPSEPTAPDREYCTGTIAYLQAIAGDNIRWYRGGSLVSTANPFSTGQTTVGTYDYTVTQTMNGCESAPAPVTLTIFASAAFTSQPTGLTNCVGTNATFSVTVTGPNLTYRWRKGSVNLNDGGTTSGATSPNLTITNVQLTDAGNYTCVVSSSCGTALTSNVAVLQVDITPTPAINGNNVVCPFSSFNYFTANVVGHTYSWVVTGGTINGSSTGPSININWGAAGSGSVTLTESASAGCFTIQNYPVNKVDAGNPSIVGCPANITVSASPGTCSAVATWLEPFATDLCTSAGSLVWSKSHLPGSSFPVGITTVIYSVQDQSGNTSAPCSFTVTVTDNQVPVITAPAPLTVSSDASVCTASGVALGVPVTSDNCSVASVTNDAPALFPPGATNVTWTVTDGGGNSATATQTVTVVDNVAPVARCKMAFTVYLDLSGNATITAADIDNGSTDNCGIASMSVFPNTFNSSKLGANTVTLTITDARGNSSTCDAMVIVADNSFPVALCKDITVQLGPGGTVTISGASVDNGSYDLGGIASMVVSPNVFTCSDIGANPVVLTVTNNGGKTATCNSTVTVVDNIIPAISCPGNINVFNDPGVCGAAVTYLPPVVIDNCTGALVTQTAGFASGSTFPIGTTTNMFLVTDGGGNSATCSFTVSVSDNEDPVITLPAPPVINVGAGCQATLPAISATFSDNCTPVGSIDITQIPAAGTIMGLGITTVTITATDLVGNSASKTIDVTVTDATKPVITTPADITLDLNNNCQAPVPNFLAALVVSDNCTATGALIIKQTPAAGSLITGAASTNILIEATDASGNTSSVTVLFITRDITLPVVVCKDANLYIDGTGNATLLPSDINNGSTDNCSPALSFSLSKSNFSCSDIGTPVSVILTGKDASLNSATCTALVTVLDTVKPVVNVKSFDLVLDPITGSGTLLPSNIDNGSFDNCGSVTLSIAPTSFNCGDQGVRTVTLTALDSHGNSRSKTVQINVSSTLNIDAIVLSSCDLFTPFAHYSSTVSGGTGTYTYSWNVAESGVDPYLTVDAIPPFIHFSGTSSVAEPYFNNLMPDGTYHIGLTVTDGNGCTATSQMVLNKNGLVFNNITEINSNACEGETKTYSVAAAAGATYLWQVTNGSIIGPANTNEVNVQWNMGVASGTLVANITQPDILGNSCGSSVENMVTLNPIPLPLFDNPAISACSNAEYTYTLKSTYASYSWTVTGGAITGGGAVSDNFIKIRWGAGPSGNVTVNVTNAGGCSNSVVALVTINTLPVPTLTSSDADNTFCAGTNIVFTAGGGTNYNFRIDGTSVQNSAAATFTTPAITNMQVVDVIVTNMSGCSATSAGITNIVNGIPTPAITSSDADNTFCAGTSVIFTAGGGTNFDFRVNGTSVQNSGAPTYTTSSLTNGAIVDVIVSNAGGCSATSTGIANSVLALPVPSITSSDLDNKFCFGTSVTFTASGGTNYNFRVDGVTVQDGASTAYTTTSLNNGQIVDVVVTNASGCSAISSGITNTVDYLPPPSITSSDADNNICAGTSITFTTSGGTTYNFRVNGASVQNGVSSTYTTSSLSNGQSVDVIVTYGDGCVATSAGIITTVVPINTIVLSSLAGSDNQSRCINTAISNITYTTTGATGATVTGLPAGVNGIWAANTVTISGTPTAAGVFNYTVTLTGGCSTVTAAGIITINTTLTITSTHTNVVCYGTSTGSVTIAASGGVAPYQYSLDASPFQLSDTFTGLAAGAYNISIRDNTLCTTNINVIITQPASALSGFVVGQTNTRCSGNSDGSITVAGAGGVAPYEFSLDGGPYQSAGTFNGLSAGAHTVIVRDFNMCSFNINVTITSPAPLTGAVVSQADVLCFGGSTGSITVTGAGGTSPYQYSIDGGPFQASATFGGLTAGAHSITVRDFRLCSIIVNITITQPASALAGSTAILNNSCFNGSTGSVDLTVSGGTSPYSFIWSNGATTEDLANVASGNYSVTISDAIGCTVNVSGTVTNPPALGGTIISQTNVQCFAGNNGSVTIAGSGGTPDYMYRIDGGAYQVSGTFNSLIAGSYSITLRDANFCTFIIPVTINQPSALSASIASQTNVSVFGGSDGAITITATGGSAPYLFKIGAGANQASATFGSLTTGTYTVTVQDNNLCTFDVTVTITQPPMALSGTIASKTNVACYGTVSGSVTVTGSGGVPPYEYKIGGGSYQASGTFGPLAAGIYIVTVRDAEVKTADVSVTITQPEAVLGGLITSQNNILCFGNNTGSITVTGTGGVTPYQFKLAAGSYQASGTFTSLIAGVYTITIQDANHCSSDVIVTLAQPSANLAGSILAQTNVSCPGLADGSVTVAGTGGTTPYQYSLNGAAFQNSGIFSGLVRGTYSVAVRDANLCSVNVPVTITEPSALAIVPAVTNTTCPGDLDGSVTVTINGGTQPFNIIWWDGIALATRSGLPQGVYGVTVTDKNGCTAKEEIVVGVTGSEKCLEIPGIITPNDDLFNDTWVIKNIDLFPNAEVFVYTRWGKLVFRSKNIAANPWDGTFKGKLLPTDSYHYILHLNDGSEPRSGVISIIR